MEDHPFPDVRDICRYPPYMENVSSIRKLRTRHTAVTRASEHAKGFVLCECRDSSVGITTGYGLDDRGVGV
jgi:hypothetical protein